MYPRYVPPGILLKLETMAKPTYYYIAKIDGEAVIPEPRFKDSRYSIAFKECTSIMTKDKNINACLVYNVEKDTYIVLKRKHCVK